MANSKYLIFFLSLCIDSVIRGTGFSICIWHWSLWKEVEKQWMDLWNIFLDPCIASYLNWTKIRDSEKTTCFLLLSYSLQKFMFLTWIFSPFWSKRKHAGLWREMKIAKQPNQWEWMKDVNTGKSSEGREESVAWIVSSKLSPSERVLWVNRTLFLMNPQWKFLFFPTYLSFHCKMYPFTLPQELCAVPTETQAECLSWSQHCCVAPVKSL